MFRPGTTDDRIRLACLHAGEPVHENAGSRGGCPRWLLVEGAGQHPRRHSATSVESVGVFMDLTPASATAAPMSRRCGIRAERFRSVPYSISNHWFQESYEPHFEPSVGALSLGPGCSHQRGL